MDPARLTPAVELPVRRARPLALGAALALLFAFGAQNYVSSIRHCPYAVRPGVRIDFASDPPGATVVRDRDERPMCVAPCAVGLEATGGAESFRFELLGHETRRVLVNLGGGDTEVEAVLRPLQHVIPVRLTGWMH
jgi:hypothetical protein